jgi:hypothetical protein
MVKNKITMIILLTTFLFTLSENAFSEIKKPYYINLNNIDHKCLIQNNANFQKDKKCLNLIIEHSSKVINSLNYCLLELSTETFCKQVLNELKLITPTYNHIINNLNNKSLKNKKNITNENILLIEKILNIKKS